MAAARTRPRWYAGPGAVLELPRRELAPYTTVDPVLQLGFLIGDLIDVLERTRDLKSVATRLRARGWTKL